jgi:sRNA-binding carbon storage regulator CsrA
MLAVTIHEGKFLYFNTTIEGKMVKIAIKVYCCQLGSAKLAIEAPDFVYIVREDAKKKVR